MAKLTLKDMLVKEMPPWLSGPWGTKWTNALGTMFNTLQTETKEAVKERFILDCSDEAVVYIGNERQIEQAPGESIDDWRPRIWSAWDTWTFAGTDYGIYRAFDSIDWKISSWLTDPIFAWPDTWDDDAEVWLVPAFQWSACPDGDDTSTHACRFWLVVDGYSIGYRSDTWGDPGTWGDGGAWDFEDTTAAECDRWKRMIRKWKHTGSTCPGIIMLFESGGWPDMHDLGGLWTDPSTWGVNYSIVPVGEGT